MCCCLSSAQTSPAFSFLCHVLFFFALLHLSSLASLGCPCRLFMMLFWKLVMSWWILFRLDCKIQFFLCLSFPTTFHIFYICLTWFTSNIPKLPEVDLTKMESLRAGFLPAPRLCGHPYPEWKHCPIGRGSTCLPLLRRRRLQGGTAAGLLPLCCLTHGCVKQRLVPPGIP